MTFKLQDKEIPLVIMALQMTSSIQWDTSRDEMMDVQYRIDSAVLAQRMDDLEEQLTKESAS